MLISALSSGIVSLFRVGGFGFDAGGCAMDCASGRSGEVNCCWRCRAVIRSGHAGDLLAREHLSSAAAPAPLPFPGLDLKPDTRRTRGPVEYMRSQPAGGRGSD
jgi:hypothetical protein